MTSPISSDNTLINEIGQTAEVINQEDPKSKKPLNAAQKKLQHEVVDKIAKQLEATPQQVNVLMAAMATLIQAMGSINGLLQTFTTAVMEPGVNGINTLANQIGGIEFQTPDSAGDNTQTVETANQKASVELQVLLALMKVQESKNSQNATLAGSLASSMQSLVSMFSSMLQQYANTVNRISSATGN